MPAMDIKWLEDLLVLMEEQSFTRAAVRRHVTQPAFSRRIRLLEAWLGVDIVDRSTKPISLLPEAVELEETTRDLVNRLYALRSNLQANAHTHDRVSFVAQHTLAISLFPQLIGRIKRALPNTTYRVNPENNNDCENAFLKGSNFLLAYETQYRKFDFSHLPIRRIALGKETLIPVISSTLLENSDVVDDTLPNPLPLLMYQQGGFLAEALTNTCLPAVMRDYRVDVICESAFSASLKEMVLADMGIAWLANGVMQNELNSGRIVSLEQHLGTATLEIILLFKDDKRSEQAKQVFELLCHEYQTNS